MIVRMQRGRKPQGSYTENCCLCSCFGYLSFQAATGDTVQRMDGAQAVRGEIADLSLNFSLSLKFNCNLVVLFSSLFLTSWIYWRKLFPTTAVNCSALFIVTAEYSDHCALLQSINILKLNGAFHISPKLQTMALHKLYLWSVAIFR